LLKSNNLVACRAAVFGDYMVVARSRAASLSDSARSLGKASIVVSIIGIVVGIILSIVLYYCGI